MFDSQLVSLIGLVVLVIVLTASKRFAFSVSAVGAFVAANVIFNCIGIIALPWVLDAIWFRNQFYFINWDLVRDYDLALAIALYVGGLTILLGAYAVCSPARRFPEPRALNVHASIDLVLGYSSRAVVTLCIVTLVVAAGYVVTNLDVFVQGIIHAYIGGAYEDLFTYRQLSTRHYLYVLLVFCVMPYLAVAMWGVTRTTRSRAVAVFGVSYATICSALLLMMFQKLPLMILLIAVALLNHHITSWVRVREGKPLRRIGGRAVVYTVMLFGALVALHVLMTGFGTEGDLNSLVQVTAVSASGILGRISVGAPLFVHYFPGVEAHYGFSSISIMAMLLGEKVYGPTEVVYQYFSGMSFGSGAIAAIIDFYAAFGFAGWVIGCALLGAALAALDRKLRLMRPSLSRTIFLVYTCVFCLYLAQASVFNALLGYGGLIYYGLWTMLRQRRRRSGRSDQPAETTLEPAPAMS